MAIKDMVLKSVVITGGSSGIGLDLAKAYVSKGCDVVLVARNHTKLAAARVECQLLAASAKQQVIAVSADLSCQQGLASCIEEIRQRIALPDLIIMSAGLVQSVKFIDQSDQEFQHMLQTNLMGSRAVAKAFLPDMLKRGRGKLCFVSSLAGIVPIYGYSGYSASKFAIIGMAGALRQEVFEAGINVSVLCPPEVDTPMVSEESEHILAETRFLKNIGGTLSVNAVTSAAVKGITKNQFLIIPGFMAKLTYLQSRLMPRTFAWCIQRLLSWRKARADWNN
ncbi:SDR family NAD(P)-dependent oxidoreductase [Aliiglaciecola sp. LCG003]|uniref:SDR family NAD(P)-dependent oxidoreductase n=1 Tax=Aliiglaciecola sp. LCG003 TaxID=3053655 RepID=UPI002573D531|nr:SDR family NAD(P)-dependent oxidoreductase [Aliiglaciecola sp. LCG003]WJG07634.1 SDR family NAD(P)-dependent oxidoreductase [Aliiglaciecola sp. LCG003]